MSLAVESETPVAVAICTEGDVEMWRDGNSLPSYGYSAAAVRHALRCSLRRGEYALLIVNRLAAPVAVHYELRGG